MNKESLKIASDKLYILVDDPRIPIIDKIELIKNLVLLLNPEDYEDNMIALEKERIRKLALKRYDTD